MTNKLCISFDQTLGARCRRFESCRPDQNTVLTFVSTVFCIQMQDSKKECNADERCRRRLGRADPLSAPMAQMQTNPAARTNRWNLLLRIPSFAFGTSRIVAPYLL